MKSPDIFDRVTYHRWANDDHSLLGELLAQQMDAVHRERIQGTVLKHGFSSIQVDFGDVLGAPCVVWVARRAVQLVETS